MDFLNIIFLVLAVAGIIATIITFLLTRKNKVPLFDKTETSVIGLETTSIRDLIIFWDNKELQSLRITTISFWNFGNLAIRKDDISNSDPLRVEAEMDSKILDFEITYKHNEHNNIKLILADNKKNIALDFDYLEFNDGLVIKIFHTGSSENLINVKGTILDSKKISKEADVFLSNNIIRSLSVLSTKNNFLDNILFPIFFIIGSPVAILGFVVFLIEIIFLKIRKPPKEYIFDKNSRYQN